MRRLLIAVGTLSAAVLAIYIWYKVENPSKTIQVKLTLQMQTPSGLRSGETILEYHLQHVTWGPTPGMKTTFRGDGVFVDLGSGKNVILTLYERPISPLLIENLPIEVLGLRPSNWFYTIPEKSDPIRIDLSDLPVLVTFSDVSNVRSGHLVDPAHADRKLGAGYHYKDSYLEITSAPMRRHIHASLPWLNDVRPMPLSGVVTSSGLRLSPTYFSRGER